MTAVQPSPVRVGVAGTTLAHGGLIALVLLAAHRARPPLNIVYEVNLVAAPLPSPAVHNAAPEATPAAPEDIAPTMVKPRVVKPVPKPPTVSAKRGDARQIGRAHV